MVNLKEQVGIKAAEFVKDGMIVGLGTGSTAYYFVAELGRRIKEEGLEITAVTTSSVTYDQAESLGIPLKAVVLSSWKRSSQPIQKIAFGSWMNPNKSQLLGLSNFQWK